MKYNHPYVGETVLYVGLDEQSGFAVAVVIAGLLVVGAFSTLLFG